MELSWSFKTKLIVDRVWRTQTQLELAIVAYIGGYHHQRLRKHSATAGPPTTKRSPSTPPCETDHPDPSDPPNSCAGTRLPQGTEASNEDGASALLLVFRGAALREQGYKDAAHEAFKEALKSRSRSATIRHHALFERATNFEAQGTKAMARKDLERILAEDSIYPDVQGATTRRLRRNDQCLAQGLSSPESIATQTTYDHRGDRGD
jgi:hypothetical protein